MQGEWSFLRHFSYSRTQAQTALTWDAARRLIAIRRETEAPLRARAEAKVAIWDRRLANAGLERDALREDWSNFLPLRVKREEDWSDWLAWLLANSRSGKLAARLFERDEEQCIAPGVDRELSVSSYRLDMRIRWKEQPEDDRQEMATVEVKVGDRNFEKTPRAAARHRESIGNADCVDWTLLPREDFDTCSDERKITWDQVAVALRACLALQRESLTWRVWARAFGGCIEQKLLGLPRLSQLEHSVRAGDLIRFLESCDGA